MKRYLSLPLFVLLFAGALLVRLVDLTDQPLEFNPTRQLYNAITARAIYYDGLAEEEPERAARAAALQAQLEKLEPPILETLVAAGYRLAGGERIWIGRVFSIAAWLLCGWTVLKIGHKLGSGAAGNLVGVAFFLFLPLGIYAGRAMMIDPAMTALFALSFLCLLHWLDTPTWQLALLTGLVSGLAILVKGVGVFILGPVLVTGVWLAAGEKDDALLNRASAILKDGQVWGMLVLTVGPALLYYAGIAGDTQSLYTRSGLYRLGDILSPSFYIRWLILLDGLLGVPVIFAAFAGTWLAPARPRRALLAFWLGYGIYGLAFPKLITTHDYYQLPLVLITAVSLIPPADLVARRLMQTGIPAQIAFAGLLLLSAFYPAWVARSVLLANDHRDVGEYWELVAEEIPTDGRAVGYTQDYGFQLMYYGWRAIGVLPQQISAETFEADYAGADYFASTAKNQMSPDLAEHLENTYPVIAQGGGYVVYDLRP